MVRKWTPSVVRFALVGVCLPAGVPGCSRCDSPSEPLPNPAASAGRVRPPAESSAKPAERSKGPTSRGRGAGVSASPDSKSYVGYLEIDPLPAGKGTQAAVLHTYDGKRLTLAQRYRSQHLELADRRVVVHGHLTQSGDAGAKPSYRYLETEHIRLAPGQREHDPPLSEVPPPPVARSKQDLEVLPGAWRAAMGTCHFTPAPMTSGNAGRVVERVELQLDDGFVLTMALHRLVGNDDRYSEGAQGTMVVHLGPAPEKKPNPVAFCVGEDRRCGR